MSYQILIGDVIDKLKELPDNSIQTCITSPPYWGLRDYGTATWINGDANCDHLGKPMATRANVNKNTGGFDVKNAEIREFYKDKCGKCGAQRIDSQLGLEPNPQDFVRKLTEVFNEIKRVLKNDGTLWLNLGDTYSAQRWSGTGKGQIMNKMKDGHRDIAPIKESGLPDKNLVGIPWRVAFALQDAGWILRQDIIWAKPNPMPESVRDRCTKSHEYLFLLSQQQKYYYDHEAIKEPALWSKDNRAGQGRLTYDGKRQGVSGTGKEAFVSIKDKRNKRDVWNIASKPFKGAHFAVMPEALVEPCILAGSKVGDTVLDPFAGSGTVGVVAIRHGRKFVGIELNPAYAALAEKRICG